MIHLLAATPLLALLAQAASSAAAAPYRVGPGDVIEVAVDGRPDLSRLPTVQTTGRIWLPRAGDVDVRGLTTPEISGRVAPLLAGDDLPAPRVAVRVAEYHSQFVWVNGAVNRPGRKPLRAGTRLVDALLDAGGFQQGASGEVVVVRSAGSFQDGSSTVRLHFSGKEPTPDELERLALPLASGDVVTANVQRWVAVSGAISRPGQYAYEDALTLSGLVEQAGGLLRSGSDRVILRRAGADQEVDLGDVREGKAPDTALQPGDEVIVKARRL
jgi:protein involved in polysaccharide export with SLBB domain